MKKLISITIGIISILSLGSINVSAASYKYHGYVYEGDKINNIYYKNKDNTLNEARIYKRSDSENITYSIEYDNNTSGASTDDYDDTFNYKATGLTKTQTDKMNLIGYYGYNYKDDHYDHSDIKWYAITQYLIWQVEGNNNLADLVDANGNKIYTQEIKEIEDLIKHHYIKPNFGSTSYKIKIYDELTIEDQNNIMDEYELESSNDANYSIQDSKITIKMNKVGSSTLIFHKHSKRYTNSAIFYVSDKYRNAMQIGKFESISHSVSISSICGKVFITKSGEQLVDYQDNKFVYDYQSVAGSIYYLYAKDDIYNNKGELLYKKDEKVSELITGESDSFDNLYLSNYYVKEVANAYPYLVNNEIYDVSLDEENKYQTLSFKSDFQDATVSFKNIKQDISYKDNEIEFSYNPSSGTEFALYNREDIYSNINSKSPIVKKDTLLGKGISDSNGIVSFDLNLPLGSYYITKLTEDNLYHGNFDVSPFIFSFDSGSTNRHYTLMDYYNLLNTKNITFTNSGDSKRINIYNQDKELILSKNIEENLIIELPYGEYYYQVDTQEFTSLSIGENSNNYIDLKEIDNKGPLTNKIPDLVVVGGNKKPTTEEKEEINQNHFTVPDEKTEEKDPVDKTDEEESKKDEEDEEDKEEQEEEEEEQTDKEEQEDTDEENKEENDKTSEEEKNDEDLEQDENKEDNGEEEETDEESNNDIPPIEDSKDDIKEPVDEKEEDDSDPITSIPDSDSSEKEDESINDKDDIVHEEENDTNIPSFVNGSINEELNVNVPATDSYDLVIYISFIILFLSSVLYINAKE